MIERPEGTEPPCDICPKQGPEFEHLYKLSRENLHMIRLYHLLQSPGFGVPEHLIGCTLFAENYGTVDDIVKSSKARVEREQLAEEIALLILRSR